MAGRQVASHLDLTQNNDPASPPSGLTRIKAKVDGDVVVVTPDGQEKSIVNVDGHPIDLYNSLGLISKDVRIKQFVAVVQSDANGDFIVDWSAAGFTQPPFSVTATAFSPVTATVRDRAWATMRSDITTTQGRGYTLRGALIVSILVGGTESIRTAPNVAVHVVAWGI